MPDPPERGATGSACCTSGSCVDTETDVRDCCDCDRACAAGESRSVLLGLELRSYACAGCVRPECEAQLAAACECAYPGGCAGGP